MESKGSNALLVRTRNAEGARLDPNAVSALQTRLQGPLLRTSDSGYSEAIRIWNGMIDKRPALVVQPTGSADVVEAVKFARENRLPLSVKGGGHNIAGTALADGGVTLDMSRMRRIDVDPQTRTARVGPGCRLRDVDRETQAHGLATVLGFVSDTGVAGLTLGGGVGYLARRFGWTVDNLLEVEIVTPDGEIRRANPRAHEDLFWAVRGGGGNFGVVTEFVYRLHEVGPEIAGGLLAWPAEEREQVQVALEAYRDVTGTAPRELTVFCTLQRAPSAPFVPVEWRGRRAAVFLVCHTGPPERVKDDLAPLTGALGPPIVDLLRRRPYTEQQSLVDATQPDGMHNYWKSDWAAELSDGLLTAMRDLSLENPIPMGQIGFLHVGGALNERAPDDGAVGNRDARFALGALGMWAPNDPAEERYRTWIRQAWSAFRPFSTGGAYVNFLTEDEGEDRVRDAYGANLTRLTQVKRRYDPENLMHVNKNIKPA